eukprot:TRINITY_DN77325_c0_g1_i1.p1 TRINITY_DN77325_c0_g1~~TRINITY_DN77325_c0_g1_i1.p1  ORF type:complete len:381 (+),score=65.16 TRINITY_DN77325_c0_g1_i1:142-1284(+)
MASCGSKSFGLPCVVLASVVYCINARPWTVSESGATTKPLRRVLRRDSPAGADQHPAAVIEELADAWLPDDEEEGLPPTAGDSAPKPQSPGEAERGAAVSQDLQTASTRAWSFGYSTFLGHEAYLEGVLACIASVRTGNAKLPFKVMMPTSLAEKLRHIVEAQGAEVVPVGKFPIPASIDNPRFVKAYNKLHVLLPETTQLDVVCHMDADTIAKGNLDTALPFVWLAESEHVQLMGVRQFSKHLNDGIMLLKPSSKFAEEIFKFARHPTLNLTGDQAIFRMWIKENPSGFSDLSGQFNMRPFHDHHSGTAFTRSKAAILHFIGVPKPWEAWNASLESPRTMFSSVDKAMQRAQKSGYGAYHRKWALRAWQQAWKAVRTVD